MARAALGLAGLAAALTVAAVFGVDTLLRTEAQQNDEPAIDFAHPTRHFRVPNPARLSDADALSIYDRIRDDMVAAYRLSRDPVATQFYRWRRYNRVPSLSAAHGNRYINNYANAKSKVYSHEGAGPLPTGAVLAKDSFTVTRQGDVFTGPLFLMEKMPSGFSAAFSMGLRTTQMSVDVDWRILGPIAAVSIRLTGGPVRGLQSGLQSRISGKAATPNVVVRRDPPPETPLCPSHAQHRGL